MNYLFNGLFFTLLIITAASCDLFPGRVTVDFDYKEFQKQKSLWNSTKPDNYQYRLEYLNNGFSTPIKTLIFVENGNYKNQLPDLTTEDGYISKSNYDLTITEVYERIEEEYQRYNNSYQTKKYDYLKKIEILYDTENHIPIIIKRYYFIPANVADAASYAETNISEYKVNN
jgi:hypothetical protein